MIGEAVTGGQGLTRGVIEAGRLPAGGGMKFRREIRRASVYL
jgi:hypothetical protein